MERIQEQRVETGHPPEVEIKECQTDTQLCQEALNRALALLARWALRHGQKALMGAGINTENRVTGAGIKGYGGNNRSN